MQQLADARADGGSGLTAAARRAGFPEWPEVMDGWGSKMLAAVETAAEMAARGFGLAPDAFTRRMRLGPHLLAPTGARRPSPPQRRRAARALWRRGPAQQGLSQGQQPCWPELLAHEGEDLRSARAELASIMRNTVEPRCRRS